MICWKNNIYASIGMVAYRPNPDNGADEMVRQIIHIDSEQCIGCGLCVSACQEGAIALVDGKAVLLREDYCDGLGNCLPLCPSGAITFETRDVAAFTHERGEETPRFSCPGTETKSRETGNDTERGNTAPSSQLRQWPVQLTLVAPNAPFLEHSDLLIAADCAAFAHGSFHQTFMKGRVTLIGCPKLDNIDYSKKLAQIIADHTVRSITVARMEVPCCGGLDHAVKRAIAQSGKIIPLAVVTITSEGDIIG